MHISFIFASRGVSVIGTGTSKLAICVKLLVEAPGGARMLAPVNHPSKGQRSDT